MSLKNWAENSCCAQLPNIWMLLRFKECEDRKGMWSSSGNFYISSAINRSVSVFKEPVFVKPKHTSLEERQQGEILVLCIACWKCWVNFITEVFLISLPSPQRSWASTNGDLCTQQLCHSSPNLLQFCPFSTPSCAGELGHSWLDISRKGYIFALWLVHWMWGTLTQLWFWKRGRTLPWQVLSAFQAVYLLLRNLFLLT